MLVIYLASIVIVGAIPATNPSYTAALKAWYGLLIGGGFAGDTRTATALRAIVTE